MIIITLKIGHEAYFNITDSLIPAMLFKISQRSFNILFKGLMVPTRLATTDVDARLATAPIIGNAKIVHFHGMSCKSYLIFAKNVYS